MNDTDCLQNIWWTPCPWKGWWEIGKNYRLFIKCILIFVPLFWKLRFRQHLTINNIEFIYQIIRGFLLVACLWLSPIYSLPPLPSLSLMWVRPPALSFSPSLPLPYKVTAPRKEKAIRGGWRRWAMMIGGRLAFFSDWGLGFVENLRDWDLSKDDNYLTMQKMCI